MNSLIDYIEFAEKYTMLDWMEMNNLYNKYHFVAPVFNNAAYHDWPDCELKINFKTQKECLTYDDLIHKYEVIGYAYGREDSKRVILLKPINTQYVENRLSETSSYYTLTIKCDYLVPFGASKLIGALMGLKIDKS